MHDIHLPVAARAALPLEFIAIAGSAFAINSIAQDGETTWFEGLLLVVVYALLALAFFFVTA
jgi:Ca2+:H+ antiporter